MRRPLNSWPAPAATRRPHKLLDAAADLEASHGQDLLRGRGGDEARAARRRDKTHANATTGAGELHGDRVREARIFLVILTPIQFLQYSRKKID